MASQSSELELCQWETGEGFELWLELQPLKRDFWSCKFHKTLI